MTKGRAAELRKSALYEVWRKMLRQARREGTVACSLGVSTDLFPVDPMFQDFAKFALWARLAAGYDLKSDSNKFIARKDKRGRWEPDNCFFSDDPQDAQIATLMPDITRGAKAKSLADFAQRTPDGAVIGRPAKWQGLSASRLYDIWKGMCRRCTDPRQKDYKDYGGRGITVCDAWRKDFLVFHDWAWEHGYSPDLSIDRIDFNAGYCPENCRWASDLERLLNRRKYAGRYTNIRLRADRMRELLAQLPDNAVVTLIVRTDYLPDSATDAQQDDYPATPPDQRVDKIRCK